MTVKLQEEGNPVEDKSQSDKREDCKKSDTVSLCQCVCHSKISRASAITAVKSAVVDLTVSPRKEMGQQMPPAPEHSKYLSFLHLFEVPFEHINYQYYFLGLYFFWITT